MGVSNNSPTFSYVHFSGVSVIYNNELYMVQDYATNKKYIYYNVDLPNQLNSSNVMPNRSLKQFLVAINDNGMATLVPSTSDDFSISFDGNSTQAIKDRIFGLYEKNEQFGEKFVAIEQDINGIKQIVGEGGVGGEGYDDSAVWEKISQIEQTAEKIDLSVKETTKKYNDDKETNQLRENLNSSIIKINSNLGTFKSEITTYFKNNEITEEETIQINTQLGILENEKVTLDGYVDTVKLVAEKNNQTQDVVAIESAKRALDIAHNNLKNNISNAIIDSIITSTENTIIIDSFAKYNLRLNELKKTCDDIIILGLGGVITEELANISIKADEIRLSVSKVESDFKTDMSVQKIEIESQIKDVSDALGTFENTVNTVFKDGIIDETEKILLQEKIDNIDKEKLDVDAKYNSVVNDENLSEDIKTELITKYEEYNDKHSELKSKIEYVISDDMVNDAEKLEINTLFKEYANVLAYFSALMTKAVEDITFNTSKAELEQAKNDLKGEIDDVKDSIAGIGGIIDGTFEDNILDEVERKNIEQNLENLSRERIDIDNTYNSMYASEYLLEQSKEHFKIVYDEYVDAFNEVVSVSTGILNKETLIDNVDRANLDSAILAHKDKLNLLSIETNKVMDIIALNKSNALKGDMQQEISDVNNRIDDILGDISGAVGDGIIDEAEAIIIKNSLDNIKKEKLDVDAKYSVIYENEYLNGEAKTNLIQAKNEFDIVIENLISTITTIIEDNKVTDDESIILEESKQGYMEKSAILNTRFQEAIDYISRTQVDKAKEQFQKEINDLGGVLSELENTMNGAFQDGILTEAEKLSIKQHLLTLSSEKSDVDKQYETIFANEHLEGQPKTDLSTAYNSYVLAYNSLVTVINNILEKEGLIDSTDRNRLNNAFKEHDSKLGLYSTNATNALDAIAKKKAEVESEKLDKKFADIIIDLEEGITSKVEHLNTQVNGDGGISERLQIAEEKITEEGITQIVKDIQYIKDFENGIETNRENISKIDQKADKIELSVSSKVDGNSIISAINMSPESIKINSSKINITGFVTFSDLRGSGTTTINGSNITTGTINGNLANITNINASNITTGTINTSRVNIKGGTTKKIVIANDNYCVYDGAETDVNRKIFVGFRTNVSTNVPSVILGYNGVNPNVDGAVVNGGTYTTYSHYPNNNNPESINQSYGALAFKYGAGTNQFSTLNMYQNGDIDLKSGASMYFRPNLRDRGNHAFAITDTSVGCRVPFQCTSSIYTNGNINTDAGLGSATLNVTGQATVGGILNVKNGAIYGMNRIALSRSALYIPNFGGNTTMDYIRLGGGFVGVTDGGAFHFITNNASRNITLASGTVYLPQGGGNNNAEHARFGAGIVACPSSGTFHFLTASASPTRIYASNVTSAYSLEPVTKASNRSVFDEINSIEVVDTTEGFRLMDTSARLTSTNKTPKAVYTTYNEKTEQEEVNIDYTTAISTLWKAVQELKQENEGLKEVINS